MRGCAYTRFWCGLWLVYPYSTRTNRFRSAPSRLPGVVSEHTGGRDFFSDGVEGFIVPPRDVDALVQRLEELIQDEPLRQRMSEAALRRVAEIGGWDAYGERWAGRLASESTE